MVDGGDGRAGPHRCRWCAGDPAPDGGGIDHLRSLFR
jgi:hypothetical protein